jgi:NADP-dependent 3-hydroxy acid dehydrogenase YdfG
MTQVAVVTGATGGIGAALVRALAGRGDRVLAIGRDAAKLKDLCGALPGAEPVPFDLRTPTDLPASLRGLVRLDAFIHCAGVSEIATVEDAPYSLWLDTFTVNVAAAAELTRALLPALRGSAGHVIYVNAAPGLYAVPRWSAYAGSKVALRELADSLRQEEAPHRLRVTTVYPGGTATERLRTLREQFGRPFDPAACIQPDTLASLLVSVLEAPADAYLTELSVMPTPR